MLGITEMSGHRSLLSLEERILLHLISPLTRPLPARTALWRQSPGNEGVLFFAFLRRVSRTPRNFAGEVGRLRASARSAEARGRLQQRTGQHSDVVGLLQG